ncbi:MAG: ABC transporter ATP-binding protein [Treponema sp.]|nr:ABC transporter ATP-binding protein [Treponema sp.]
MNDILTIVDLEKTYVTGAERLTVFRGLHMTVPSGSTTVIVGASGSGKSTLLNIIGGIDTATAGTVYAGDWEVTRLDEDAQAEYRSRFLGLVFQFHYLLKDFTARENIAMPALIAGTPRKEAYARADQLLADVGLTARAGHLPSQLSGGERQRAAVARALVNNPELLLADEPTGNLDPIHATHISDLLFSLVQRYQKTLILVTHDRQLAARGEQCYTIVDGRLERCTVERTTV